MVTDADPLLQGIASYRAGNFAAASTAAEAALHLDAHSARAHNLLGMARWHLGDRVAGMEHVNRAVALDPSYAAAHNNLGALFTEHGEAATALDHFAAAARLDAGNPEYALNAGSALFALGRHAEAAARYAAAVALAPDLADAQLGLGLARLAGKETAAAIVALDAALRIRPTWADALQARGQAAYAADDAAAAVTYYDRAIAAEPDRLDAYYLKAGTLIAPLGRFGAARDTLAALLARRRDYPYAIGQYLYARLLCADWQDLPALLDEIDAGLDARSCRPFVFQAVCADPARLRRCSEVFNRDVYPARAPAVHAPPRIEGDRPLRIGYVAGEFREHATSILATEVFECHDPARFELYAFDNGWDDGGPLRRRQAAVFRDMIAIRGLDDEAAARRIAACGIDILVDLNGYFGLERTGVFAWRPAPIQVNYLGFPATLGAPYFDYLIGDATVTPAEHQPYYCERLVRLPDCYQPNDSSRLIASDARTRADYGLPESGFVYCCFNNVYKILPAQFALWLDILRQTPGSVLWLLGDDDPTAGRALRDHARAGGVDPLRIVFAPREPVPAHLARQRLADLFLDTLPYNAHTTASDALWAGLPVLTCLGEAFPGRVGASLLRAVDLPELVTTRPADYCREAIALAGTPERLAALRRRLADQGRQRALFDCRRYTRHLEAAYETMWTRVRQGLAPTPIDVPPLAAT